MKSSVYRLGHGIYLAVLEDRQIMRGSVEDLAAVLMKEGITLDNLLFDESRQDAELLDAVEQTELRMAMTVEPDGTEW